MVVHAFIHKLPFFFCKQEPLDSYDSKEGKNAPEQSPSPPSVSFTKRQQRQRRSKRTLFGKQYQEESDIVQEEHDENRTAQHQQQYCSHSNETSTTRLVDTEPLHQPKHIRFSEPHEAEGQEQRQQQQQKERPTRRRRSSTNTTTTTSGSALTATSTTTPTLTNIVARTKSICNDVLISIVPPNIQYQLLPHLFLDTKSKQQRCTNSNDEHDLTNTAPTSANDSPTIGINHVETNTGFSNKGSESSKRRRLNDDCSKSKQQQQEKLRQIRLLTSFRIHELMDHATNDYSDNPYQRIVLRIIHFIYTIIQHYIQEVLQLISIIPMALWPMAMAIFITFPLIPILIVPIISIVLQYSTILYQNFVIPTPKHAMELVDWIYEAVDRWWTRFVGTAFQSSSSSSTSKDVIRTRTRTAIAVSLATNYVVAQSKATNNNNSSSSSPSSSKSNAITPTSLLLSSIKGPPNNNQKKNM